MLNPERCWQAVASRDRTADGTFLYGVRTGGIYCRPGCPSRQPKRENTLFFPDADAAERAGYRPCKRCRPRDAAPDSRQRLAVERACRIIRDAEQTPTLAALARAVGVSRYHLHRTFRAIVGATPGAYARQVKLDRLASRLDGGATVADAVYGAGYGSSSRAYEAARTGLGMTPGARRRGGEGKIIRFATAASALGTVLLAATERGVCAVELGDDVPSLEEALRHRFPAAEIVGDANGLAGWLAAIVRFIDRPDGAPDLPLDIAGTAFQARVWRALQRIPPGTTVSYGALAAKLGQPNGARAVARACATNDVALLVPCHRVIGGDGALHGYRWGLDRKRALLEREAAEKSAAERKQARG